MSSAIKSQGTKFEISNEDADATAYGSATFAEIKEVDQLGEFGGEANNIDVTHLRSTAKEYLVGLEDGGTANLQGNWIHDDPGQLELIDARDNQQRRWLKITWSNSTVWYRKVLCKKFAISAQVDSKVPFTATLLASGSWGYA